VEVEDVLAATEAELVVPDRVPHMNIDDFSLGASS
jgi:hypothetical protein